jgi:dipeptidyl aminopeptidase/acylaminoacyl peptidase
MWVDDPSLGSRLHAKRITARDLAGGLDLNSFRPSSIRSMWQDAAMRPQHPSQWSATRGFADSGGLDVVLVDAPTAVEQRLTQRPGDDYFGSWSPDGRLMAIATDRWSNQSHSAIAIVDPERPERVVRLTGRTGVRDVTPLWSPDGSRIAFVRQDMAGRVRANRVCWVTVDGRDSACPGKLTNSAPYGWSNPRELVVLTIDSANVQRILAVEITSGAVRSIAEGRPLGQSRAAGWIACVCRRHRGEPYRTAVMSTEDTSVFMTVRDAEPPPSFTLTSVEPRAAALDQLAIRIVGRVTAGQAHRLRADATDGLGRPMEPVSLQWESADSLTATLTADGLLQSLRPGRVRVRVTSGGWRSDSAVIEINSPPADRDTIEEWRSLSPKWLAFGTPRPYVTTVDGRRALAPNGDSTHSSGVISNWRLPTSRGVGVEFDLSVPVTADQWQHIFVSLAKSDSTERRGWDTTIGDVPTLRYEWTQCGVYFPTSIASQFAAHLMLNGGIERAVPVAPGVARGDWVRIRLQYFPDGRCAMAVNGRAVAIIDRPLLLGDSVALHVRSYSHRTRVLVGPVRAWTGVRAGVDWSILDPSR